MINEEALSRLRIMAIILLVTIGVSAIAAGYSFMITPSGHGLKMNVDYLKYSPFKNFLIPGVILFISNGLFSILAAIITIRKEKYHHLVIFLQGWILSCWIIIQIILVRDFNFLHFFCLSIGIALIKIGSKLKPEHTTSYQIHT